MFLIMHPRQVIKKRELLTATQLSSSSAGLEVCRHPVGCPVVSIITLKHGALRSGPGGALTKQTASGDGGKTLYFRGSGSGQLKFWDALNWGRPDGHHFVSGGKNGPEIGGGRGRGPRV